MRALVLILVLAACGGSFPTWLLGKPCSSNSDCAATMGIVCAPINLDARMPPAPEYACELPATGECPEGTKLWVALLTLPDPLPDGPYQTATYCAPECTATCDYERQCFGVCGR